MQALASVNSKIKHVSSIQNHFDAVSEGLSHICCHNCFNNKYNQIYKSYDSCESNKPLGLFSIEHRI